ncbi:hypothetical protein D3C87_1782690 [compost metagenome]
MQPLGKKSSPAVLVQTQPVVERVSVIVLPRTGAGALTIVQTMVPVPSVAVPDAVSVQFGVGLTPPIAATFAGLVPLFIRSSNGIFSAEISARPAVTLAFA